MAISSDLFSALLSLDVYNRGYREGLNVSGNQLGTATVGLSEDGEDAEAASFFAQSYTLDDGSTVIAYRGSDSSGDYFDSIAIALLDDYEQEQIGMATEFYRTVAAQVSGPIITTGHSLGGALAGMVASGYGLQATLFNNVGFYVAYQDFYAAATEELSDGSPANPDIIEAFYGSPSATAVAPNFANLIRGYWLEEETAYDWVRPAAEDNNLTMIGTDYIAESDLSSIERHGHALTVILQFAEEPGNSGNTDWQNFAEHWLRSLHDDDLGDAIGFIDSNVDQENGTGFDVTSSQMRTAIAYSVIDEGARPFGDTGIRALYNDANDLGRLYDDNNPADIRSSFDTDSFRQQLADLVVLYAGAMAFSGDVEATHQRGIIHLDTGREWLAVNFTDDAWTLDPAHTGGRTEVDEILGRDDLIEQLAAYSGVTLNEFWQKAETAFGRPITADDLEHVQFALSEDANTTLDLIDDGLPVSDGFGYPQQEGFGFAVGNDGDNEITSSFGDNILIGADGDDTFYVRTLAAQPTPPPPPPEGEDPEPIQRPTVMIYGGSGNDTVDHSEQLERLHLSLESIENGSVRLVLNTDGGEELGEYFEDVEAVRLTEFNDVVSGTLTASGVAATTDQPLLVDGGLAPAPAAQDATQSDTLDFSAATSGITLGTSADEASAEIYGNYEGSTSSGYFAWNIFVKTGGTDGDGLQDATGLSFIDFEHVIGSDHDEVLGAWSLNPGGAVAQEDIDAYIDLVTTPTTATLSDPAALGAEMSQRFQTAQALIEQNNIRVRIEGGDGNDTIQGTQFGINEIYGGDGHDVLLGGGFASEIYGGAGDEMRLAA